MEMPVKKRPNIIIFNPDHYRGDVLSHLGNPAAVSPNLDQIVEEGATSFSSTFVQSTFCTPSRCSFMSGWYPHVRGHRTMFHMMQPDEPVLLKTLKDNGYFVFWGGKNDLVPAQNGFDQYCTVKYDVGDHQPDHGIENGDQAWRGDPKADTYFSFYKGKLDSGGGDHYHDSDWANVMGAIDLIETHDSEQPLCVYLPLLYPHPPYAVEDPWFSMIDKQMLPKRRPGPERWSDKSSMLRQLAHNYNLDQLDEEVWDQIRSTAYGMSARVDHQFGMVVDALKRREIYDDTAIFFFSDHGEYQGDYSIVGLSQNTFEDSISHVPLIIKPPSTFERKAATNDQLVELIDVCATIEEITGIEPNHRHFGKSLIPLIEGTSQTHRSAVFCEGGRRAVETECKELEYVPGHIDPTDLYFPRLSIQSEDDTAQTKATMCRTHDHKYVQRLYEHDELYDLRQDPFELNNVIGDAAYSGVLSELKDLMLRFYLETSDVVRLTPDERW